MSHQVQFFGTFWACDNMIVRMGIYAIICHYIGNYLWEIYIHKPMGMFNRYNMGYPVINFVDTTQQISHITFLVFQSLLIVNYANIV